MGHNGKREFKTLRSTNSGPRSFRPWNEWDNGDSLVLKYQGEVENKFDDTGKKPNYLWKILEVSQLKNKKFKFEHDNLVTNTSGKLKYLVENLQLQKGEVVSFKYLGTSTLESGKYKGKEVHDFDMEVIDWEDSQQPEFDDL